MKAINKFLLTTALLLLLGFQAQAQSDKLINLLDKIEDGEGVTSVLVTKKMFELFTKTTDIDVDGESLNKVISGLKELKIFDIDRSVANKMPELDFDKITKMLVQEQYEILLKIRDDGNNVDIYIFEQNDVVKHLFLLSEDGDEMQLISLLGDIDLENISKLSGTLNIDALEQLEKK